MNNTYIVEGNRKHVLVLLHGWGLSKKTWKNILPALSKSYTVYALDLLGFGENQTSYTIFSLDDYVRQVNDFLQKRNIKKCVLLGHSFGGLVATSFTIHHPEKVKKVILYSSGIPFGNKKYGVFITTRRVIGGNLVMLFSILQRALLKKIVSLKDINQLYKIRSSIRNTNDFSKSLREISQPVLLIAGRFDYLVTLNHQKMLQKQFSHAQLVIFNRSTHVAHIEEKDKFTQLVKEFIDSK